MQKELTINQNNKKLTPCLIRSFETRKLGDGSSPRHVIVTRSTLMMKVSP
jgi:hypothetical protein